MALDPEETPEASPYLDTMKSWGADRRSELAASLTVAQETPPEEALYRKRVARILDVPEAAVQADPKNFGRLSIIKEADEATADTPAVREQLTDPTFAALAKNDVGILAQIERKAKSLAAAIAGFGGTLAGGMRTMGEMDRRDYTERVNELYSLLPEEKKAKLVDAGVVKKTATGSLESVDDFKSDIVDWALERGERLKAVADELRPDDQTFVEQTIEGLGQLAAQVGLMALTRGGSAAMMFTMGVDQAAEKIKKDKAAREADRDLQDLEILTGGLIIGATEWLAGKFQLGKLQSKLLSNTIAKRLVAIAEGGVVEGGQEAMENLLNDVAHIVMTNPDSKVGGMEALQAGGVGTAVGALFQTMVQGALHIRGKRLQNTLASLSESAKLSDLRQKDPTTFQNVAEAIAGHLAQTSDGPVEDIYLDSMAFAQVAQKAGVDPAEVAAELGVADQLEQAASAGGGDLVLPLQTVIGKIAGSELGDALIPHLRSGQDSLSIAERETSGKMAGAWAERLTKAEEEITLTADQLKEFNRSATVVRQTFQAQLDKAGKYNPSQNRAMASFLTAVYSNIARRRKEFTTPEQLYAMFPYKMEAGTQTGSNLAGILQVSPEEANAMAATARKWGGRQKVYRAVESIVRQGDSVLDYGSGKLMEGRAAVVDRGGEYTPHDPYQGIQGDLSRAYDVVMASNVMNVQTKAEDAEGEYNRVLDELSGRVNETGTLVVNMPTSGPRADWMSPARLEADLRTRFKNVTRQGEVVYASNAEPRVPGQPWEKFDQLQAVEAAQDTVRQIAEGGLPLDAVEGLKADESGALVFNVGDAARALAERESKLNQGVESVTDGGRFMRGSRSKEGPTADQVVAAALEDDILFEFDDVASVEEAQEKSEEITRLTPIRKELGQPLRYDKNEHGYYGNDKMEFPNDAYPKGRNTWDIPGCGRLAWALINKVKHSMACYGGKCYAEVNVRAKQGADAGITKGLSKRPVRKEAAEIQDFIRKNGVEAARRQYPDVEIKIYDKISKKDRENVEKKGLKNTPNFFEENGVLKKISIGQFKSAAGESVSFANLGDFKPIAAVVSTQLKPANGQDIRLGLDTDGSAWLADSEVMDALLAANPRSLTVYSSAYHTPPAAHPLAGRTIINVTVSGWHPLPETLARLRWAEEARANGWNVILREVVADPESFDAETVAVYNRIHNALLETDFFIMQQSLHIGDKYGAQEPFGLPGCCRGSLKNPHTCDSCEVAEGLGKRFQEYWNIVQTDRREEQILPDVTDDRTRSFLAQTFSQTVWHGTPYPKVIKKFSTKRVGSGEGRAEYGWGLYASQLKEVAEGYWRGLSKMHHGKQDRPPGGVYKVEMDLTDDQLLNWDLPLYAQSEQLEEAVDSIVRELGPEFEKYLEGMSDDEGWSHMSGEDFYISLSGWAQDHPLPGVRTDTRRRAAKSLGYVNFDKDASLYLLSKGVGGIKYAGNYSPGERDYFDYVVFSEKNFKIQESTFSQSALPSDTPDADTEQLELFQVDPAKIVRATFDPVRMTTRFLEATDVSSFFHEGAHLFLEMYSTLAAYPNADETTKRDMQTLLEWFKIPDLDTWNRMSMLDKKPYHEQFAYNFETFIAEGKAPSPAMGRMFDRFKKWLTDAYKDIRASVNQIYKKEFGKDLPILTNEVRQVMERMISSDAQIERAQRARAMVPLFMTQSEALALGLTFTDDEWDAYRELHDDATNAATSELRAAYMQDMKWLTGAKSRALSALQRQTAATRKAVRAKVAKEVQARRIYQAEDALKKAKASKDPMAVAAVVDAYGPSPDEQGWSSQELLEAAIAAAPKRENVIEELTDQRMLERHGDMVDPVQIEEATNRAVYNELRGRVLAAEFRALAKAEPSVRVLEDAARNLARLMVGKLTLPNLKASRYSRAEVRAGRAAMEAAKKGDLEATMEAKHTQLIHHMAAREVHRAKEQIRKAEKLFKKVFTADARLSKGYDMNYVGVARAILAQYGFGKTDKTADAHLELIRRYEPEFYAEIEPMITAHKIAGKTLKDLTVDEFVDLAEQIEGLWHLARRTKQSLIDGKLVDRKQIVAELADRVRELTKPGSRPGEKRAATDWEKTKVQLLGAKAAMRRVESWVDFMDGKNSRGPFRRYIWEPISEAATRYRLEKVKYLSQYRDILAKYSDLMTGKELNFDGRYTFTPQEFLHALLHTGNKSNKTKLLVGREWGTVDLDTGVLDASKWDAFVQANVTERQMDFCQEIWDLMESTKPAAQKAHKEMYGFYFGEITAEPVTIMVDGKPKTYRGGYVPAVTDSMMVTDAAINKEKEDAQGNNSYMFPTTGRGFTKQRIETYTKPLLLDLGYLHTHIDKVLRFSHLEPRIKDVGRVVKSNRAFGEALDRYDPTLRKDMLIPWLQRTATQLAAMPSEGEGGKLLDRLAGWARRSAGIQIMVGNVTNTMQQFTGLFIALTKVRPRHLRNGTWRMMRQPKRMIAEIEAKSPFMRTRITESQYEIQSTINKLLLDPNPYQKLQQWFVEHGYVLQQFTQGFVDCSTWMGAYEQAVEQGHSEPDAVRAADEAVRLTQGSFNPEDASRIETGHPFVRLFSQFMSYFNMQANILGTEFGKAVHDLGGVERMGRLLYVYAFAFMAPAVVSEIIVQAMSGFDDGDDDEYDVTDAMRLFFGSQARTALAMAPGVGQAITSGVAAWNKNPMDDRIRASAAITTLEAAVRAPHTVYKAIAEEGNWKTGARDFLTLLGLISGLPLGQLGKPVGYALAVEQGKAEPESVGDVVRGVVSGQDVNRETN